MKKSWDLLLDIGGGTPIGNFMSPRNYAEEDSHIFLSRML